MSTTTRIRRRPGRAGQQRLHQRHGGLDPVPRPRRAGAAAAVPPGRAPPATGDDRRGAHAPRRREPAHPGGLSTPTVSSASSRAMSVSPSSTGRATAGDTGTSAVSIASWRPRATRRTGTRHPSRPTSSCCSTCCSADELDTLFERLGYRLDRATIPKIVDYYLSRTSHGSTLSAIVHAWVLARSDRLASWRFFLEALDGDVHDVQGGTTSEGIHLGATVFHCGWPTAPCSVGPPPWSPSTPLVG